MLKYLNHLFQTHDSNKDRFCKTIASVTFVDILTQSCKVSLRPRQLCRWLCIKWFFRANMSIYRENEDISKHLPWAFNIFSIKTFLEAIQCSYFLGVIKALIAKLSPLGRYMFRYILLLSINPHVCV